MPSTSVVLLAPFSEPAVRAWRAEHDWSARAGAPAHITLLGPFLPPDQLTARVYAELTDVFRTTAPLTVALPTLEREEATAYLRAEPADELEAVSRRLHARWPHLQPHGARFRQPLHQVTVARHCTDNLWDRLRRSLAPVLPLIGPVRRAALLQHDGQGRIVIKTTFEFGKPPHLGS